MNEISRTMIKIVAFTESDMARAREIRSYAERRENFHTNGAVDDPPFEKHAAVFASVRTAYTITRSAGREWKHITFSLPDGIPSYVTCLVIAIHLFGFDQNALGLVEDPTQPHVRGFFQPWSPPS